MGGCLKINIYIYIYVRIDAIDYHLQMTGGPESDTVVLTRSRLSLLGAHCFRIRMPSIILILHKISFFLFGLLAV